MQPWQNTFILSLGEEYDMLKLGEVVALPKFIREQGIEHIIVDAHALKRINVMGLEILALRDSLPHTSEYSLLFVGLKPALAELFALLDSEKMYNDLVNFNSIEEALTFIATLS